MDHIETNLDSAELKAKKFIKKLYLEHLKYALRDIRNLEPDDQLILNVGKQLGLNTKYFFQMRDQKVLSFFRKTWKSFEKELLEKF